MAGGINGIAPTAVAALLISITLVRRRDQCKLAIAGTVLSLYVILVIDSRGALLFAVLALMIVALVPWARGRGGIVGWFGLAMPVLPVILALALTNLANTDIGTSLNRQGAEDIGSGTGRTIVWEEVMSVVARPSFDNVIGYGRAGQSTSGASVGYAYLFRSESNPLTPSAHNAVLQAALDIGWIGVLCLAVLVAVVLSRLARHADDDALYAALGHATLGLALIGIVQAALTPTHLDGFAFWVLVVFAVIGAAPAAAGTPHRSMHSERAPAALAESR
jgi:hypothetical protein